MRLSALCFVLATEYFSWPSFYFCHSKFLAMQVDHHRRHHQRQQTRPDCVRTKRLQNQVDIHNPKMVKQECASKEFHLRTERRVLIQIYFCKRRRKLAVIVTVEDRSTVEALRTTKYGPLKRCCEHTRIQTCIYRPILWKEKACRQLYRLNNDNRITQIALAVFAPIC